MIGLIKNRYEIIKSIGDGSTGKVYLAKDVINDNHVALKIMSYDWDEGANKIIRFENEIRTVTRIINKNIISIYDIFEEKNAFIIVMEYVGGKNLKKFIEARGTLSYQEAIFIMKQIINAIKETHKFKIIHRDLKPQNILITQDGIVKIIDFGIAINPNSHYLTATNNIIGSIQYLAPEIINGEKANERSDIYALGIIFFEMVTGNLPLNDKNPIKIAHMQINEETPSVKTIIKNIPQSIDNFIRIATAKNPINRFGNALAFEENLNSLLSPERINEKKITLNKVKEFNYFGYQKKWTDSRWFLPFISASFITLIVIVIFILIIFHT